MAKFRGAIVVDTEHCKGCSLCVVACPTKVIELNPDVKVSATFVESDTLVFLKLLYAGKGYHYDVVCMGDDSMLSAAEQKLIYPMDEFVMRDLGLAWLDAVPCRGPVWRTR